MRDRLLHYGADMAEAEFKLPSSSFQEVSKIIQAYAQINRAASLEDVSKRIGMNSTTVSGNNGFLLSLGIIEGGKSKAATAIGKKLGDALGHSLEDETRYLMRQIVESSEFLKSVLGAIRIRRGMDESALRSHIAYSAGAGKTPAVLTGAGAVVELLWRSGAIEPEDGRYIVSSSAYQEPSTDQPPQSNLSSAVPIRTVGPDKLVALPAISTSSGITLAIEVRINCSVDELNGLGEKLKALVEQLSQQPAQEE